MSQQRLTGRVKWFNKKSGYGFISVCGDSDYKEKEIFAHFSAVSGKDDQYKYLVQGEYVEFEVTQSKGDKHEFQAASISGVMGGPTMCDTHRDNPRPLQHSVDYTTQRHGRRDSYGESEDGHNDIGRQKRARVSNRH